MRTTMLCGALHFFPDSGDAGSDFEQRSSAVGLRPDMLAQLAGDAFDCEPASALRRYRDLVRSAAQHPNLANADNFTPFRRMR